MNIVLESFTISELTFVTDMLAAVAFAVSGSLVALRKELDILGFAWLSIITGVGGGTVRDLILDIPVFWLIDTEHILACMTTAVVMFFLAPRLKWKFKGVLWFDALGLALVTVVGTMKACEYGAAPLVAVVMGVVTGSVGGIIRDTIGGEKSVILLKEIYVTAAVVGASIFVLLSAYDVAPVYAAIIAFLTTFLIRGLAITYSWTLPGPLKVKK